jgi:putative DNA primase/helicase
MSTIHDFLQAIQEAGIGTPTEIIPDGKLHRFDCPGDKPKTKKGWYILFDGEPLAGSFGRWQGLDNGSITWCGKVTRTLSPEEKRAYAKRMDEARQQREAESARVTAECRAWCARIWESAPEAPATHPYLSRKRIPANGLRLLRTSDDDGALMVPVKDSASVIQGMQFISPDGSKKFKTGTAKAGNCYRIGTVKDDTIIIAEGFATASSVHQATGHCVLVSFDAGNLQPVAELIRSKRPGMRIILAADNDAWVKITDDQGAVEYKKVPCNVAGKRRVNTGVVKATEAMTACSGVLAVPAFRDVSAHPTDWNDLHLQEGIEAVAAQFDAVMNPQESQYEEHHEAIEPMQYEQPEEPDQERQPFQCLGYEHNTYYYLPRGSNQVIPLRAEQHGKSHLITLAPINYWEAGYPAKSGANYDAAANALIRFQERKGVYDPSRLRGRGAWEDGGRSVLHLGNLMYVNGSQHHPHEIRSHYIYEAAPSMEYDTPCKALGTPEANRFVTLCDQLMWERPIYGRLLAGWCIIAPICGALKWRPHVHLTGGAGVGKSWTVSNIVALSVGPAALQVVGSTTAAAIRQTLGADARPVIHDEFEAEEQVGMKRIQEELELARACSSDSEALTLKGGADGRAKVYRSRAAFCFSSIGVNMSQQADVSRVTVLSLRKDEKQSEQERQVHFDKLVAAWSETMTEEYCCALRARTVHMIPTIRKNAETFARAAAVDVGTQRTGDQLGAMLAGVYSLFSMGEVTLEKAKEWIKNQDWSEYAVKEDQMDEQRCLAKIMQTVIRAQGEKGICYDQSISELISIAQHGLRSHEGISELSADAVLKRHGIKVSPYDGTFAISNTHIAIEKCLEKTPWSKNWPQLLARLPGSEKTGSIRFSAGIVTKAVQLPLDMLG